MVKLSKSSSLGSMTKILLASLLISSTILTVSFLSVNGLQSINGTSNSNSRDDTPLTAVRNIGGYPLRATYDTLNHYVYVSSSAANTVTVLSGNKIIMKIVMPIFSQPEGILYNPSDNYIYVADSNTDSISIISNVTLLTTFSLAFGIGSYPGELVYDPGCIIIANVSEGCVVAADYFGNRLEFFQYCHSSSCVGENYIQGFDEPNSLVYLDPYNTLIVTNNGNFSATQLEVGIPNYFTCNTPQMRAPTDIAYDPANGYVYVTTSGYSTGPEFRVYVLDPYSFCYGKGVVTYIPVDAQPLAVAYDPNNKDMYVTLGVGNDSYIAINAANAVVGKGAAGTYPIWMVFNEFTNKMNIIDYTRSGSVTIVS